MLTYDDPRRQLLAHYPEHQRSAIANLFLFAVRRGAGDPEAVLAAVLAELRGRLGTWGREDQAVRAQLATLMQHRADALDFAGWTIDWESLPREERERQKGERGDRHRRQWTDNQPPTEKQVGYLRSLGYTGEVRSKTHASQLIGELKRARVA